MAITTNSLGILGSTFPAFPALGRTLTIGRLGLYAPLWFLNEVFAKRSDGRTLQIEQGTPESIWFDAYLRAAGTPIVEVLDASRYEGATIEHDLNRPIPRERHETIDTLIDGGTLEHVFNVVNALENYLKLLKVGGRLFLFDMPLDGLSGHGFFQFSPIFFSETLAQRYGFQLDLMLVAEDRPFSDYWNVSTRLDARERVELQHPRPCHLHVVATKTASFEGFDSFPLQPDYQDLWKQPPRAVGSRLAPAGIMRVVRSIASELWPRGYFRFSHDRNQRRQTTTRKLVGLPRWEPRL